MFSYISLLLCSPQLQKLAYDNEGHLVNGVNVPTQGFNVFASLTHDGVFVLNLAFRIQVPNFQVLQDTVSM